MRAPGIDARWTISADDLEAIAIGAGILGTGGGGNPYVAKLWVGALLERGMRIDVVPPELVPDDALVVGCGGIGAPTVSIEKLRRGDEEFSALRALEAHLGRRFDAVVPMEIGGANAMRPMAAAAHAGIPIVDADGMGRAFPELQMVTFFIYGVDACPAAIADDKGEVAVLTGAKTPQRLEQIARTLCVEMGGTAGMALAPMSGAQLRRCAIRHTVTLARAVGRAVLDARRTHADPVEAVLAVTRGVVLLEGKITDVERRTAKGFARGHVDVGGTGTDDGKRMRIQFQNENLVAELDGGIVATVPDLICIVAQDDAEPITTELLRYGYRVVVLVIPAQPLLCTAEALAVVGPAAFGYDVPYRPFDASG